MRIVLGMFDSGLPSYRYGAYKHSSGQKYVIYDHKKGKVVKSYRNAQKAEDHKNWLNEAEGDSSKKLLKNMGISAGVSALGVGAGYLVKHGLDKLFGKNKPQTQKIEIVRNSSTEKKN